MSQKSTLLIAVQFEAVQKGHSIEAGLKGRPVINWPAEADNAILEGVRYALVWQVDPALFARMPDLEVIFSAGAGVDKILSAPSIPDVPIIRFVDPTLTNRMSEWICLQCLMHLRQQRRYDQQQSNREWQELRQVEAKELCVGIMGMGVLGQDAAKKLLNLGFEVVGWSRSAKSVPGVDCYDQSGMNEFLSRSDLLVGLLPSTPQTAGFFGRAIFERLRKKPDTPTPVFINAGRGQSQNESELIGCLQDGTLKGASLDVFETEPLSEKSPLWGLDNVILTPHIAASSDVVALGRYVDSQIERYESDGHLENIVDRNAGY